MIPENRTLTNPFLTIRETNEVLTLLRGITNARAISANKYGQSLVDSPEENRPITLLIRTSNIVHPFSILLVDNLETSTKNYNPAKALGSGHVHDVLGSPLVTPATERDHRRIIYCTNGEHGIGVDGGTLDCWILGTSRPHPIRYTNRQGLPGQVLLGDRLGFTNDYHLIPDSTGPFVAVSNGTVTTQDDPIGIVWVIVHHHQLSYIPWVQTCVPQPGDDFYNSQTAVYPAEGSNTFVVRRGELVFPQIPGYSNASFVPYTPNEYYIAFNPCGYIPIGTIRRMTIDHSFCYLTEECGLPPSSSSVSSSSIPSSSISSSSSQSSSSQSQSSSSQSQSSSAQPSSSSQSESQSSSSQSQSSSSGQSQSSSSSSSQSSGSSEPCCYFVWGGFNNWSMFTRCSEPDCLVPGFLNCRYSETDSEPPFDGEFFGQVVVGICHNS